MLTRTSHVGIAGSHRLGVWCMQRSGRTERRLEYGPAIGVVVEARPLADAPPDS